METYKFSIQECLESVAYALEIFGSFENSPENQEKLEKHFNIALPPSLYFEFVRDLRALPTSWHKGINERLGYKFAQPGLSLPPAFPYNWIWDRHHSQYKIAAEIIFELIKVFKDKLEGITFILCYAMLNAKGEIVLIKEKSYLYTFNEKGMPETLLVTCEEDGHFRGGSPEFMFDVWCDPKIGIDIRQLFWEKFYKRFCNWRKLQGLIEEISLNEIKACFFAEEWGFRPVHIADMLGVSKTTVDGYFKKLKSNFRPFMGIDERNGVPKVKNTCFLNCLKSEGYFNLLPFEFREKDYSELLKYYYNEFGKGAGNPQNAVR